jgi:nicotinamide-nucleotide amidase
MNADAVELKTLMLRTPRLSLAVAESLTCGRLQARIGAASGASEYFLGGVTTYSLEQKIRLLGVERAVLENVNSVSAGIAEQMARGVGRLFGADVTAATTGYAEPNAAWKIAHPFAWIAVARREGDSWKARSERVEYPGATRTEAQERIAEATLAALLALLREVRG